MSEWSRRAPLLSVDGPGRPATAPSHGRIATSVPFIGVELSPVRRRLWCGWCPDYSQLGQKASFQACQQWV
jgi:hypothetical protein